MTARFDGSIVLVTGGGSGIGRTVARAFAREGATVVVAGRRAEPLAETVQLIRADGGRAEAVPADVTQAEDVARLLETIAERYDRLDVAVNNAGALGVPGPLGEQDEDAWSAVLAVNLTGTWLAMKHEIAQMRRRGGGAIVNISSIIGAHLRLPNLAAYAATKAGVSALTRVAAREYIGQGIRINAVSPGPADTSMSRLPGESDAERDARIGSQLPVGRIGKTDEVAAAVLWLASPESSFVVGHDLVVDGGATA